MKRNIFRRDFLNHSSTRCETFLKKVFVRLKNPRGRPREDQKSTFLRHQPISDSTYPPPVTIDPPCLSRPRRGWKIWGCFGKDFAKS